MHVVRLSQVAELDSARGGGHQAHQICVRINTHRRVKCTALSDTSLAPDRYDHGITTFDTANVRHFPSHGAQDISLPPPQVYSNGLSEIILGNAIKKLELPREEIVIMTKAGGPTRCID